MEKNILVVSEHSPSTLAIMMDCPEGTELIFCTDVTDVRSAELMISWHAIDEVCVVGLIVGLPLCAVIDYAEHLGAPVRRWQKSVIH
jgi:hypothetical protein